MNYCYIQIVSMEIILNTMKDFVIGENNISEGLLHERIKMI